MIRIEPLTHVSEAELAQVNSLLQHMRSDPASHRPVSAKSFDAVARGHNTVVLGVRDGADIIGTGTIVWNQILTGALALIEDVVIDSAYRGQGLGEQLVRELIRIARERGVETIALTSRPSRVAANGLYQKLGFQKKETNYYELKL